MPGFFYASFAPVLLGLALAGLIIYWDHQRQKALVDKGLYQPLSRSQSFLAWGLVLTGTGIAVFVGSFWVGMPEIEIAGLAGVFLGLALIVFSAFVRTSRPSR